LSIEASEVDFCYSGNFEALRQDRFMLEVDEKLLNKLLGGQHDVVDGKKKVGEDEDVEMATAESVDEEGFGEREAHEIPGFGNKVALVGQRDEIGCLVTKTEQMGLYQLKNSNSQLLVQVREAPLVGGAPVKGGVAGRPASSSSSGAGGPPPAKRLKPSPGAADENVNLLLPAAGTSAAASSSSSSSAAGGGPPAGASSAEDHRSKRPRQRLEIFTGFEDIILLRAAVPDLAQVQAVLQKEYPCFFMPGFRSNNIQFCTGEELRYRLQVHDDALRKYVAESTQVVATPGRGFQWLSQRVRDKMLEMLVLMVKDTDGEYMDAETKAVNLEAALRGFTEEFDEMEFVATEAILRTVLRALCDEKLVVQADKLQQIVAEQVFVEPSMPLLTFLREWQKELPVDYLDLELGEKDVRKPFYVIRDLVVRAANDELPQEPRKRLEKLFLLSPVWYQQHLEELLEPVMPTGVKSAAWLLKFARATNIWNPKAVSGGKEGEGTTGAEEVMFSQKFGSLPQTVHQG